MVCYHVKRVTYTMRRCWILFLIIYQANACLDLLVRSFNEIFSPIVETGDGRIRKPHNVDDLTTHYKIDEYGNITPISEMISNPHSNLYTEQSNDDESLLMNPKNPDFVSQPRIRYPTISQKSSAAATIAENELNNWNQSEDNTNKSPGGGPRKRYKYRGGYVPGKSPLVDFFIKLIESLQLTRSTKFITSHPRYENSQLQYLPNIYHDSY